MNGESNPLISNYVLELNEAVASIPTTKILKLANILKALPKQNTVYIVGNGGSATTAAHMATDLGVGSLRRKNPVRCISLVENSGILTATSNDVNFASVFASQLKLLGRPGDILISFSASGDSENLIQAVQLAKTIKMLTVGITGFDGGRLREICDLSIHTQTKIGSYGVVEDVHSSISHILTEIIRNT